MDLPIKQVFLAENEKDIFARLSEEGIDTKAFASKFQYLFQKIYNNEVGYYSFKQDDKFYKFIVLPKTISLDDPGKERAFVNYLLHYYRVNNKYGYDETKKIPNSLLSLAFESNNKKKEVHNPIELFEFHKTKAILKSIESFFQKHKHYKRVEQDYISQSIKHKLNLGKNIKEINKSKIHQTKKVDVFYSQIATVSYYVLKLYVQRKLPKTDAHSSELRQYTNKIGTFIARKYQIDKKFSLSLPKLYSHKISKVFQKKQEHKMLLANLRSLFGYEQFYQSKQNLADLRHDLMISSFFVNPSLFYEWYVYDILKKYTKENNKELLFDKKEKTKMIYCLNSEERSSNPDFIIIDEDKEVKLVLDAKWKNIETIGNISHDDYLKLQFDVRLQEQDGYGVIGYLVYPKLSIEDKRCEITFKDKTLFSFNLLEIDMDFANQDNSLSFEYDFKAKADEIEKLQESKKIETLSTKSSKDIQDEREKIVHELIEADDKENRESIGGLFDEKLWQKTQELVESIDQKILPEVQELLDEYDDVLEDESKTFLKSTSTIYAHFKKKEDSVFDFSMPASGLWKLIEVELNTSFVRYIRLQKGVITKDDCWKPILDKDDERNINWVKLNEWDKCGKLKGLMFGQLKYLSRNGHIRSLFRDIIEYDFDEQWKILDRVTVYRNEHAHIKAMSKDIFENLWSLMFDTSTGRKNNLQKILKFKRDMRKYIDER